MAPQTLRRHLAMSAKQSLPLVDAGTSCRHNASERMLLAGSICAVPASDSNEKASGGTSGFEHDFHGRILTGAPSSYNRTSDRRSQASGFAGFAGIDAYPEWTSILRLRLCNNM